MRAWMVLLLIVLLALVALLLDWQPSRPTTSTATPSTDGGSAPVLISGTSPPARSAEPAPLAATQPTSALPPGMRTVDLRVARPDGTVPEGAMIRTAVSAPELADAAFRLWKRDASEVTVDPSHRFVKVHADDMESPPVRLPASGPVEVRIGAPTGPLWGRIVTPDGWRLLRADVVAIPVQGDEPGPWPSMMDTFGPGRRDATVYEKLGTYVFRDLPPGRYRVALSVGGPFGEVDDQATLEIGDEPVQRDLTVDLERRPVVRVAVRGPSNARLPDAHVRVGAREACVYAEDVHVIRFDRTWDPMRKDWRPQRSTGERQLLVKTRFGTCELSLVPDDPQPIEVHFEEHSSLGVQVDGLPGELASTSWIALHPGRFRARLDLSFGRHPNAKVPADGVVRFDVVQPGAHELRLYVFERKKRLPWLVNIARFPATVGPGDNTTLLRVPALHTIRATGEWVRGSTRLVCIDEHGPWLHQHHVRDENATSRTFRFVPPGRYEIRVRDIHAWRSWPLRVPDQLEIDLRD